LKNKSVKMKNLKLLPLLFLISLNLTAQNQEKSLSKAYQQLSNQIVIPSAPILAVDYLDQNKAQMGLGNEDQFRLSRTTQDHSGIHHKRYQQYHKDIPVHGSNYTIHEKNLHVTSATGYYLPRIEINTTPNISEFQALEIAIQTMAAEKYSWEIDANEPTHHLGHKPTPTLVIVGKNFPEPSEYYALAYKIDLHSAVPLDGKQYFIDAHTGQQLFDFPLIHHTTVPAQGVTKYYGTQTIYVDSIAPGNYLLQDLERGQGIVTVDQNREVWQNNSAFWDFTNADQDEVAIDAHYAATAFYDYLLGDHNWNGLGNNGEELRTVVHGGDFVNAFWNGEFATFGDGDCNRGPLTTLEVVAHEFTHGLTDYTSDLIYSGESGAINESMSDVFGKALEYRITPDEFKWSIGESFLETPYANPFRSMEDPNERNHPKMYKGQFWTDGGGVHTNSSIGNHWFYLLVEGKTGTNEIGVAYDVEGIGMDNAMKIVFQTQSNYLTSNSTYTDYYTYSQMAAEDLFGAGSSEKEAVTEAWKAVGLPYVSAGNVMDLAVNLGNTFTFVCGQDVYHNIEVMVSNIGSQTYAAGMGAVISINGDVDQSINQNLNPGESTVISFDEYLLLDYEGTENVQAELEFDLDTLDQNNDDFQIVENSFYPEGDLGILTWNVLNDKCSGNQQDFNVLVSNRSCSPIAAGTSFTLKLTSLISSFTWEEEITLENPLAPDRARGFTRSLEIPFDQNIEAELELTLNGDPNLDNNMEGVFSAAPSVIKDDFYTAIDDSNFEVLEQIGFFSDVTEWNNDFYFVTTGYTISPNQSLCPTEVGNIEANFASSGLTFCLDYSEKEVPSMSFDLIQFRNNEAIDFPELYPYSSLARVRWEDESGIEENYYFDQAEGQTINNELDLPNKFNGKVTIEFSNYTGQLGSSNFTEYDVNLFDNLTIEEIIVSTLDPDEQPEILIQPNPSTGKFFIKQKRVPQEINILNSVGQLVNHIVPEERKMIIDLSTQPNGIYFLNIKYSDQVQQIKKLIKTSEQ